jgi:hypothetical protein
VCSASAAILHSVGCGVNTQLQRGSTRPLGIVTAGQVRRRTVTLDPGVPAGLLPAPPMWRTWREGGARVTVTSGGDDAGSLGLGLRMPQRTLRASTDTALPPQALRGTAGAQPGRAAPSTPRRSRTAPRSWGWATPSRSRLMRCLRRRARSASTSRGRPPTGMGLPSVGPFVDSQGKLRAGWRRASPMMIGVVIVGPCLCKEQGRVAGLVLASGRAGREASACPGHGTRPREGVKAALHLIHTLPSGRAVGRWQQ